jgi:hypothetical protein
LVSTYVTWALVLIALGWGAWVLFRPGGGSRSGGSRTDANRPGEARVDETATVGDEPPAARATPLHQVNPPVGQVGPPGQPATGPPGQPGTERPVTGGTVPPVPNLGLWDDSYTQNVRDRWRDLQLRFIDDPHSVADEAERVVEETVTALTSSLNKFKEDLDTWRSGPGDTEELRTAVYRYREFLDRMLGT